MDSILISIVLETLISGTLAFIAIVVPFSGALWIYRKGIESNSEIAIFQIGREIATELRSANEMSSPMSFSDHLIEQKVLEVDEANRDQAIKSLLRNAIESLIFHEDDEKMSDDAALIMAIATDRLASLVPEGIQWSGRGPVYSSFGEEISLSDSLFPFGTKLYRQWIERFSDLYNDLWVCTGTFHRDNLVEQYAESSYCLDKDYAAKWLNHVKSTTETVNELHSKLLTQIQIIDTRVNERFFRMNLLASGFWLFLLLITGYALPRFLSEFGTLNWISLSLLFASSMTIAVVLVHRLLVRSNRNAEDQEQRAVQLPVVLKSISQMKRGMMGIRRTQIDNLLSMKRDLRLPNAFCDLLSNCSQAIVDYNHYSSALVSDVLTDVEELVRQFPTTEKSASSFSISVIDLTDEEFDIDAVCERLIGDENNFVVETRMQQSSRDLHLINLGDLSAKQRQEFAVGLKSIRQDAQALASYKNFIASWLLLAQLLSSIEDEIQKMLASKPFDLVSRWAS